MPVRRGRHSPFPGDKEPRRGLRPLTVLAMCSVVAVLAVVVTQAVTPRAHSGGGSVSAAEPGDQATTDDSGTGGGTDAGPPTDDPTGEAADPPGDESGPAPAVPPGVPPAQPPAPAPP